jgi:hypothetical protein
MSLITPAATFDGRRSDSPSHADAGGSGVTDLALLPDALTSVIAWIKTRTDRETIRRVEGAAYDRDYELFAEIDAQFAAEDQAALAADDEAERRYAQLADDRRAAVDAERAMARYAAGTLLESVAI